MESQRVRRPEGPQDWEAQRAVITDLYITQGLELEDLMETMEEKHFFKATKKQYKTYFTDWKLRKNVRPSEYNAIIKKKRKREEEGKDSAFRLRGALVNDSKIVRYEKKTKRGDEHEMAEAGTPDDLSCFTPSPVASSPNTPSPVLPHFRFRDLPRSLIVEPFEHDLPVPSPLFLFPKGPDLEMDRTFSKSITPLVVSLGLRSLECRIVNNTIMVATCQRTEYLESSLPHYPMLHSSLIRLLSDFIECARKRMTFSRIDLFLFQRVIDTRSLFITRLKPASTDRGNKVLPCSLQINVLCVGANGFKTTVTAIGRRVVVNFSYLITKDLEQKHNSPVRRSKSCESIRSIDSFLSDPIVNWKDLLYGYNREAASKEREF